MKGLKRNIKYWFFYLGKVFLMLYGMVFLIVAATTFLDGEFTTDIFFNNMALYSIMLSVLIVMVYAFTNMSTVFPMTVSLGARRSKSIIAMILAEHVIALVSIVLSLVFFRLSDKETAFELLSVWPIVLSAWFLLMAIGSLVAFLSAKFGQVLGVVLYVIAVAASVVLITTIITSDYDIGTVFVGSKTGLMVLIMAAALILDILTAMLLNAYLRKKELKFA